MPVEHCGVDGTNTMKASTLVSFNTRTLKNLGFVWTFALLVGGCLVANTSDATDDDDGEGNVVGGGGASVSSTTTGQAQTTSTGGSGDSSGTGGSEPAEEERLCLHASPPTGKGKPFTGPPCDGE